MTYAGLKSMIYAGLTQDDPRVKAAIELHQARTTRWTRTPARASAGFITTTRPSPRRWPLLGKPTLVDAQGKEHDWRAELVAALAKRQDANGGWVNRDDRFMEGDPNIVTSYALLALAAARPKA